MPMAPGDVLLSMTATLFLSTGLIDPPTAGQADSSPSLRTMRARGSSADAFRLVANGGQWDEGVCFAFQGRGKWIAFERGALTIALSGVSEQAEVRSVVRLVFVGASPVEPEGSHEREERLHFFVGNDPARWCTDVPSYEQVIYRDLYPGIHLVGGVNGPGLKYDLLLQAGVDPSNFHLRVEGADATEVDPQGRLVIRTAAGDLTCAAGETFRIQIDGSSCRTSARFIEHASDSIGIHVDGEHEGGRILVDPTIVWSTYLGGSTPPWVGDAGVGVAFDSLTGDVLVTGFSEGTNFPQTPGTYQHPGAAQNVFVSRLRARDGALVYSSVIGGTAGQDYGYGIDVGPDGSALVTGITDSPDFPTTPGSFDPVKSLQASAFVLKLSPSGNALVYSTYLEGTLAYSIADSIRAAPDGSALVVGLTSASDFPVTPGAFDVQFDGASDGFVTRLDSTGSSLLWSTFLGGTSGERATDVVLDSRGDVTIVGDTFSQDFPTTPGTFQPGWIGSTSDANVFVARLTGDGSSMVWGTFLAGSGVADTERALSVAVDANDGVCVGGVASAVGFPTTPGAYQSQFIGVHSDGFVTRFDSRGGLLYSTYLGNSADDFVRDLVMDRSGIVTAIGLAGNDHPTTPGAWNTSGPTGGGFYISRFDPALGRLLYSTFFGGTFFDDAFSVAQRFGGSVAVSGLTNGGYPTTPGSASPNYSGGQSDAFVSVLDLYLQGVEPFGNATPACLGPLAANSTRMPAAGASSFSLYASDAPPVAEGWLLIGSPASTPILLGGAELWLDPQQLIVRRPVVSDSYGWAENLVSLAALTPGSTFAAQFFFRTSLACPGRGRWCASHALLVTVQ